MICIASHWLTPANDVRYREWGIEGSLLAEYIGAYVGINGTPYRWPRSGYGSAANIHELRKKKSSDVVL